jgi:hypothetical protein
MRPKIFDLLFKDDRTFVLEVSTVTTRTGNGLEKKEWAVITRRNVIGYPPHRSDCFPARQDAIDFYKKVVVSTPRVSLGNKSPEPLPTIEAYTRWIKDKKLYDQILNPEVPLSEKG